mgnify:CR=1
MRRLSKIVSIVTTVFTVAVILCAGVFCLPRIFGYVPYVVLSGSMEPVIGTGAVAFINTNDRAVSEGDIIAYSLEDTVVIHRVISRTTEGFITMGDANDNADANSVAPGQVVGTYSFQIPCAGYLLSSLEQHPVQLGPIRISTGILLVVGMVILLNIIDYLLSESAGQQSGRKEDAPDVH